MGPHPKSHTANVSSTDGTDIKANDDVHIDRAVLPDDDNCANQVNVTQENESNVTRRDDSQASCDVMVMSSPLKYVTATVSNTDESSDTPIVMVKALKDSGAEMAVISETVVKQLRTVKLSGVVIREYCVKS